ncbi:hypothetical protein OB919_06235 [Halobacteria archaeon AArc-curdl1]|uniref:Uncharacterized protein n=1 Tax=Natronosalvus hydrolyticus TaxID=2979988 RepID=A0AAP2Z7A4_9EURY|nr:hypothetical protein [Halobacteria archaeon AArc-curdl1]
MNRNWPHWNRLAPQTRSTDIETGLRAKVHDPLWLLSRQWQLAEFRGADAGTPVDVTVETERDPITSIHLHGDGEAGAAESVPYDGGPLEPLIEREAVLTAENAPSGRLAAEAGGQFRRLLASMSYGEFDVDDFPAEFHLEAPDEAMESADRRYFRVMDGRALDGRAIYLALAEACPNLAAVTDDSVDADPWQGVITEELPLPTGKSADGNFEAAALAYARWYRSLYDEPNRETGTAWRPTRLEYDATVMTGAGDTAGAFEVSAYQGGRLDRDDFVPSSSPATSMEAGDSSSPQAGSEAGDSGATDIETTTAVDAGWPTQVNFPGMPNRRWWEFADASLAFTDLSADGVGLATVMILDYAVEFGADWFQVPIEVPVGSYVRVTDCTVTDTFGIELSAGPIEDEWRCFRASLPGHDEPGLLVPPTLGSVDSGDPVEEVVFGRDEMANLVFGLERVVEGPAGAPVDRTEFLVPGLEVATVHMADDPDREYVTFENPGEDSLDIDGHFVRAVFADEATAGGDTGNDSSVSETTTAVYTFDDTCIEPGGSVTLFTGTAPTTGDLGAGLSAPVWRDADALDVYALETDDETSTATDHGDLGPVDGRLVTRKLLQSPDADGAYRLATAVPPYWFPFTMDYDPANPPTLQDPDATYRLRQALLLDADTLDAPLSEIPRPLGKILNPEPSTMPAWDDDDESFDPDADPFWLYEEEVTRSGVAVTRGYHLARWSDGTQFLWSGRRATNGGGELASGLRFDVLEEPE